MNYNKYNIQVYTDGASKGNPGDAGFGWVILYDDNKYYKSESLDKATNNQAELTAVINALHEILQSEKIDKLNSITIYSDSQYVCNAFNKKWMDKWIKEDFVKIKNPDYWKNLNYLIEKIKETKNNPDIKFEWVRGHNGDQYNEEADSLASLGCFNNGIVMYKGIDD